MLPMANNSLKGERKVKKSIAIFIALSFMLVSCAKASESSAPIEPVTATDATTQAETQTPETETADAGFTSITIPHAYGETIIESKPERIAAIAWGNADVPLALGIVPVGISEANWGVIDGGQLLPWTKEKLEELGGAETCSVFDDTDGWDYEAINECEPDIIIAASSGLSQEEYDTLSAIAPTIPYPGKAWQTSWRDQILVNSKAIGMEEEGKQLVEDLNTLIAEKTAEYPQLAGKTAAFAYVSPADLSTISFYTPTDTRGGFLEDLGFALPESLSELYKKSGDFFITISAENADILDDVDILVSYALTDDAIDIVLSDPLIGTIPAFQRGSFIMVPEGPLSAAGSPSALSIPWAIDEYISRLVEAADKIK
jgi:iron complex transport system substrate-binding protein